MKTLIGVIVLLALLVTGCTSKVTLGLGTITLDTTLAVEEWAQNPLIDNLSSLLQKSVQKDEEPEDEEPEDAPE